MPSAADYLLPNQTSSPNYLKSIGKSIVRGVPQLATGFVDLASLPFTATGVIRPDQAVGSTEYLTARGYLPPKQEGFVNESAELLSGALNPAVGMMALGTAATKGLKAASRAGSKVAKTEFELAQEIAQRRAALPIEQGGLGLPANNTAMDRANAMNWNIPFYRGTTADELVANPNMGTGAREGTGVWGSKDPLLANTYAENPGGNVMPLVIRSDGNIASIDWKGQNWGDAPINASLRKEGAKRGENLDKNKDFNYKPTSNSAAQIAREKGYSALELKNISDMGARVRFASTVPDTADNLVVFKPELIRSRFAAFDPMRRNENNLLAGTAAGGIGLSSLYGNEQETPDEVVEPDIFSILYK
jgi:hypothetical protein